MASKLGPHIPSEKHSEVSFHCFRRTACKLQVTPIECESVSSLRSFGHQGALYYVFLASDPLKTSREYAVFTLRTRGPKSVHTRNLASNAKSKCVFVLIAPNDRITSYIAGQVGGQDKILSCFMKNERFSKNGNIKNLVQKTKMGP